MDKTDVQWSFRGITTPMGVATNNNIRIKDVLPTQEQLKERMELLQKELRATKRLMKKASEYRLYIKKSCEFFQSYGRLIYQRFLED